MSDLPPRLTGGCQCGAAFYAGIVSRQHPDHVTAHWPPEPQS